MVPPLSSSWAHEKLTPKIQCDGVRPRCSACEALDEDCEYDPGRDQRRRDVRTKGLEELSEFTDALRGCSDEEAAGIIQNLRAGVAVPTILDAFRAGGLQQARTGTSSLGRSIGLRTETSSGSSPGQETPMPTASTLSPTPATAVAVPSRSRISPIDVNFLLNPTEDEPRRRKSPYTIWTTVTRDEAFVRELLSLYFTWHHPFFQLFSEKNFREDAAAGNGDHCSKLLFNAVCAIACTLTDRPEARMDLRDSRTTGAHFFREATSHLNDTREGTTTTLAALVLLAEVEVQRGRFESCWMLGGQASRIATYLSLHTDPDGPGHNEEDRKDSDARLKALWGAFEFDAISSMTVSDPIRHWTNKLVPNTDS